MVVKEIGPVPVHTVTPALRSTVLKPIVFVAEPLMFSTPLVATIKSPLIVPPLQFNVPVTTLLPLRVPPLQFTIPFEEIVMALTRVIALLLLVRVWVPLVPPRDRLMSETFASKTMV